MIPITNTGKLSVALLGIEFLSVKINGTQRRTQVSLHCTYCGMPKDTCQAEVSSNSSHIVYLSNITHQIIIGENIRKYYVTLISLI